jgi:hypothetical protein
MSKKQGPSIPDAPSFQADPNVGWSQDILKGQVPNLLSLTNLPPALMDAISLNPETSRLATQQYVSAQEPAYRRGLQDITNTLEANNQLTGSTTGNVMQNYQNDYLAGLTSANAGMALQDINRALSNRMSLYSTGLNAAQGVGQTGLNNQQQQNSFALANYENQVSQALMNQPQQNSGFWGSLGGIAGGALGFAVGGPGGAMIGSGLGSSLGSGLSGGDPSAGLSSAASAYGMNKYAGSNPNIISSSGAGGKSESIVNSLGSYNAMGGGSSYMNSWGF